jgi:hypothetical protein
MFIKLIDQIGAVESVKAASDIVEPYQFPLAASGAKHLMIHSMRQSPEESRR